MSDHSTQPQHKIVLQGANASLVDAIRQISRRLNVVAVQDEAAALRDISDADAFYGYPTPALLAAATQLRWIQVPRIGLEGVMFPALIEHPAVLTNTRGIMSDYIADHVMGFIFLFARGFHRHLRHQMAHHWASADEFQVVSLPDATLGIVGLGGIGREVARRAAVSDMRIIAVDPRQEERTPEVAALWRPERIYDLLAQSDFVVICAPETPETRGLFDERAFRAMKDGSWLINVGRGKIVVLDALVAALRSGKVAGAGLDVFEVEPLPADHPLWDMENVIITPHIAGVGGPMTERCYQVLLENVRRFVAGEPLINIVDKARWF